MQGDQAQENIISPKRKNRLKRWLVGVLVGGVLLVGLGMLWVRFYLDPYLTDWLIRQVSKGSNGKYRLEIKDLNFRVWQMTLEVQGVRLYSTKPRESEGLNLDIKARQVNIRRVDWWLYWHTQQLTVEALELNAPEIEIYNPKARSTLKIRDIPRELQKFVASFTPLLRLKSVSLLRAKCGFYANSPAGKVFHQFSRMDLGMRELQFTTEGAGKASLEDFDIQVRDYQFITPDKAYMLRCQNMRAKMRDASLTLQNVRFAPLQQDEAKDRLTLQLPYLRLTRIDFAEALYEQSLKIGKAEIIRANLLVDTKLAYTPQTDKATAPIPFPKDLKTQLQHFPVPLAIDTFRVSKASFLFRQHSLEHEGYHQAKEASLTLLQLRLGQARNIDAEGEQDFHVESGQPLFAKDFEIEVKDFQHETTSGLYRFGMQHLFLSSQDSVLRVEKGYLKPLLPAQKLAQSLAYQSIISAGELPLLIARKVNFEKMIYQQIFRLGSLHLHSPHYEAFLDATKPKQKEQEFRNFEQMLRSIPLDIQADTLAVHSAQVSYKSLQKTRNLQVEYDSVPRIATHALEKLDFTVLKIDLGRALHESAIEHIDTKKLKLTAEKYTYENAEGTYKLQARHVEASAHKRLISVSELTLSPTAENVRNGKINLYVPQMRGEGIDFVSFMLKQQMDWDKLVVEGANVQVSTTERTRKKDSFLKKFELENALQTMPAFVRLDTLQLKGATFTLEEADRQGQTKARHQVENVEVQLLDIGLGRATHYTLDSLPVFWNEASLAFALKKYSYEAQGLTYKFALQNIQKQAFAHQWHIDALSWKSALSVAQYREKFPTRKWLAEGSLGSITLDIPNLEEIIFHRHLAIQRAVIQTPKLKFWVFDALSPIIKNDSTKAWWADLQQDVPLQFSIDTLSMQNAEVECLEAQNRWTQKTKLALGISKLEWNSKLSWKNAGITGEGYAFSIPASQSALHIRTWQLNLEPAPHFKANGVRFAWKPSNVVADSSFVEVESASAYLPVIELGKPLKLNDLKVEKGRGVLYFAPSTQPKASPALPTSAQKPFVLLADTLRAKDIALTIYQKTAKQTYLHTFILEEGSLEQLHWKLQANSNPETAHFTFKIRQYETRIRQGLYQVKARNLQWSSKPNSLIIKQLSVLPTVSGKVLNRLQTHQKELLETRIKEVQARGIDIKALLEDQSIHAQRLSLDSVWLHLSADRRLPTIAKKRRMPAEQLRGLRVPLAIDTLDTQKLSLYYSEKVKGVQQEGELFVQDIDAQVLGVKTRPHYKDSLKMTAVGKLMGVGKASIALRLSLSPALGAKVEGSLGELKANFMNEFLEATRHIQIRKGTVQGAKFQLVMRDSLALGKLEAGYKHLRLDILSKKKENKKRGFVSFLANVFIKNRNNPNKKRHKIGEILYAHLPEETFVRYLIKALATGILKTLM